MIRAADCVRGEAFAPPVDPTRCPGRLEEADPKPWPKLTQVVDFPLIQAASLRVTGMVTLSVSPRAWAGVSTRAMGRLGPLGLKNGTPGEIRVPSVKRQRSWNVVLSANRNHRSYQL